MPDCPLAIDRSPAAPAPLQDLAKAADWIAEITGATSEQVRRRLSREHQRLGANVEEDLHRRQVEPYRSSERLSEFYAETDAFVYETFCWNRYPAKQAIRRRMVEFLQRQYQGSAARVLAYGDGLGFDAAGLAIAGHHVTYFEVGQRSLAFARKLFAENAVSVDICQRPEQLPPESFDAVICLDVLEHVPNPPELVRQLAGWVRPGGYMISHAPFWYVHPNACTHLAMNRQYSGGWKRLYRPAGLWPVEAALLWNPIVLVKAEDARLPGPSRFCRTKLACGGLLLRFSGWWSWPLTTIMLATLRAQQRRLPSPPEATAAFY